MMVYCSILIVCYSIRRGGHPSEQWGVVGAALTVEEFELASGFRAGASGHCLGCRVI